jgi:hypothetical protein
MTIRRQLKKKLSLLKASRRNLPMLIDCSMVYGDNSYTVDDLILVDNNIALLEKQIREIDNFNNQLATK